MDWIADNWGIGAEVQRKLLFSIIALAALGLIRYFIIKFIDRNVDDLKTQYFWRSGTKNVHNALLIIVIGIIWIELFESFATFLGLIGAGLAIALQDPIVNLVAWVFILIKRPFEIGDRIEMEGMAGDVIDIRFFQFTINEINNWVDADQSTGRIIHIPNGRIFKAAQANYSVGFKFIWNEIPVLITFESNWKSAKLLLNDIIQKHGEKDIQPAKQQLTEASKKYLIYYNNINPVIYTSVKDSGILLTMRYLCDPKKRRVTEHRIWEDVLNTLEENKDIALAYPTQRIVHNPTAGK